MSLACLHFWKVNNLLDYCWCYLHLKQFLIVVDQWNDSVFGPNVVRRVCWHSMVEVEIDPLTYIQFVLVIANTNDFDQVVYFLTHSGNQVISRDRLKLEISKWKRKVDDVHQGFHDIQFSHQLLPELKILITLMLHVVLIFWESTFKIITTLMSNGISCITNQKFFNPI